MIGAFRRTGSVLRADGQPVSGAFVTVKSASVRVPEIAIVTDSDGRFEIRLPAGVFTLQGHAGGLIGERQFVNPGDATIDIVVQ